MNQESSLIDLILDCRDIEEFSYLKSINRYVFQNDYKYNNNNASFFLKYASFELDCTHDMARFRHNMELVLNNNISTWLNYINMELKYNNINHAHNLFIRYINKYLNDLADLNTIFVYYLQFVYVTGMHNNINMDDFFLMWKNKLNQLSNSQVSPSEMLKYQNFYYKVHIKFVKEYQVDNQDIILKICIDWFVNTLSFDYWLSIEHDKINQNKEDRVINICKLRSVYRLIIGHLNNVKNSIKLRKVLVKYANFEFENKEFEIAKCCIEKWKLTEVDQHEWKTVPANSDFSNEYEKFEKILKYFNTDLDSKKMKVTDDLNQDYVFGVIGYEVSRNLSFNETQMKQLEAKQNYFFDNIDKITYEQSLQFWSNYLRFIENEQGTIKFSDVVALFDTDFDTYSTKTKTLKIYMFIQRKYLQYLNNIDFDGIEEKWNDLINKVKQNSNIRFKNIWLDYLTFIKSSNPDRYDIVLTDIITNYGKPSLYRALSDMLYKENNFDMLRKTYGTLIMYNPLVTSSWTKLFDLEMLLQDSPRTRELTHKIIDFFTSIQSEEYSNYINKIFKASVEYETEDGEYAHVRYKLYDFYFQDPINKSIVLTDYVQNWVDYAYWEFKSPTDKQLELLEDDGNDEEMEFNISEDNIKNARHVFEQSLKHFKSQYTKRYQMYQQFLNFENNYGKDVAFLKALKDRKPDNGVFPEDEVKQEEENDEEENKLDDLFSAVDNWES